MGDKISARKRQGMATKQTLFETASNLIKAYGYDAVTVDAICKASGVSKGTFYVHYGSKEDIVRESYYEMMDTYMQTRFAEITGDEIKLSVQTKIYKFLALELSFAVYSGYEITCRAYALNLSSCMPGPCLHLQKRAFSKILFELLQQGGADGILAENLTPEKAFLYLESSVRGMMASWCFANGAFDIEFEGGEYLRYILSSIFKNDLDVGCHN